VAFGSRFPGPGSELNLVSHLSVAQFPYEMGKAAVESAVKIMAGETLPPEIMVRLAMVTRQR
jgi:ABC-type sugar transport system substrate-binding protein